MSPPILKCVQTERKASFSLTSKVLPLRLRSEKSQCTECADELNL